MENNIDRMAEEHELKAFIDEANAIPPGSYCIPGTFLENLFRKNLWVWVERDGDDTTLTISTGKKICLAGFEMKSVVVNKEDITAVTMMKHKGCSVIYHKGLSEAGSNHFGKMRKYAIELLYLYVGYVRRSRAKFGDNQ